MSSCVLCPSIRTANGELTESRLYKDLLSYSSNDRKFANDLWGLSRDPKFKEAIQNEDFELDKNGEITLKSLLQLTKTNIESERIIEMCEKELGTNPIPFRQAITKVQGFNLNSQWRNDYIATLTETPNGNFKISVTKKTEGAKDNLKKVVENQSLLDRVVAKLAEHNLATDFLTDSNAKSAFIAKDAQRASDGMYHCIQIAHNEDVDKLTEDACHEAGHFAIHSMKGTPLVQRLIELLNPDVIDSLLNQQGTPDQFLGDNPRMEMAGTLVGQAIQGSIDRKSWIGKLADKIVSQIKKTYYSFRGDDIKLARIEARNIANRVAGEFMNSESGELQLDASSDDIFYHTEVTSNIKAYKEMTISLKTAIKELETINGMFTDKFKLVLDIMQGANRDDQITRNATHDASDMAAVDGITAALDQLYDVLQNDLGALIDNIDVDSMSGSRFKMVENAKKLREARIAISTVSSIMAIIDKISGNMTGNHEYTHPETGFIVTVDLSQVRARLDDFINHKAAPGTASALINLLEKEREFFANFLEDSYGSEFVKQGKRAVFNWSNRHKKGRHIVEFVDGDVSIRDVLEATEHDESLFDRFLGSMANSSDVVNQILDKVVKQANKMANDETIAVWDDLKAIRTRAEALGIKNPEVFYEKTYNSDTGKYELTGNIINELNYGSWERNFEEYKRDCIQNFKREHRVLTDANGKVSKFRQDVYGNWEAEPGYDESTAKWLGQYDYDTLTDMQKNVLLSDYLKPKIKEWHRLNSSRDRDTGRYIPSSTNQGNKVDYTNYDYLRLNDNVKNILEEINRIKANMDENVDGAMPSYRAPQFKGIFTNRLRNRGRSNIKGFGTSVWEMVTETFCRDSMDTDYGGEITNNSLEDDVFENKLALEKEKINRLPLFGINKLSTPIKAGQYYEKRFDELYNEFKEKHGVEPEESDIADIRKKVNNEIHKKQQRYTDQMSTDIYGAMLAYAGMATHYNALNNIVDTVEVGRQVLLERKVSGNTREKDRPDKWYGQRSGYYHRFGKFVQKQIYGISQQPFMLTKKIVANKIANFISSCASKCFLGGNVFGGLVNLGTGINELYKESVAGEFFNRADWLWATKTYMSYLPANLWGIGKFDKEDKMSLWFKKFNARNDNSRKFREWHTRRSRIVNFMYDSCLMLPYSNGDHYMQGATYIALARHTKLFYRDEHGQLRTTSMWNAYDKENISHDLLDEYGNVVQTESITVNGKKRTYGKTLQLQGIYFRTAEDANKYDKISNIVSQLKDYAIKLVQEPLTTRLEDYLTDDMQDFISNELGYSMENIEDLVKLLENDMKSLRWNEDDESAYMDKAREINDRMHGIYNEMDKTVMHQWILGNMLLAMRGYALGMAQRRFGVEKTSIVLHNNNQGNVEGSIRTMAKAVMAVRTDDWGFGRALKAIFLPVLSNNKLVRTLLFTKTSAREDMLKAGFSENQYRNMRRNSKDLMLIIAYMLLKQLSAAPDDDEEEELLKQELAEMKAAGATSDYIKEYKKEKLKEIEERKENNIDYLGILYYFSTRLLREQGAFNTPRMAWEESKTLLSTVPAGASWLVDMIDLAHLCYGAAVYDYVPYDPDSFDEMVKEGLITKEEAVQLKAEAKEAAANAEGKEYFYQSNYGQAKKGDARCWIKIQKLLPYWRARKVIYYPREAIKSYEYGKDVKK